MKFRKLRASEIDARVSTVSEKGCSLLLYKDARCDMNVLDETVGSLNWQRSHQMIGDRLYCTVSVWDEEKKQWIAKQDVGTESYTEKEKGQASDSFKRACFNLGIGRELYTAPFIWVPANKVNLVNKDGKYTTYDRFTVEDIGYDENGCINRLIIRNNKTDVIVYQMGEPQTEEQKAQKKYDETAAKKITATQAKSIRKTLEQLNKTEEGLCEYFKVEKIEDMTTADLSAFLKMIGGKQ